VRVAATSTAPAARRRAKATKVGRFPTGGGTRGQRHEPLELPATALGAGDLGVRPHQLVELGMTGVAAVGVDGHEGRFADPVARVKMWEGAASPSPQMRREPRERHVEDPTQRRRVVLLSVPRMPGPEGVAGAFDGEKPGRRERAGGAQRIGLQV
jgi:hypothetical protein